MPPAILDTDILSELIKLRNTNVRQKALAYTQQYGQFAFSAITRYEITRGYKDQNATTQMARFATFLATSRFESVRQAPAAHVPLGMGGSPAIIRSRRWDSWGQPRPVSSVSQPL